MTVLDGLRLSADYPSPVVLGKELTALLAVVDAVREKVECEAWCVVCGGGLLYVVSTDENPEGLAFAHRAGCALDWLESEDDRG